MESKTEEPNGRTLELPSKTLADGDASRKDEPELPQEQPLEEVQATGSGERRVLPGEGGSEDEELEKQRNVTKRKRIPEVEEVFIKTRGPPNSLFAVLERMLCTMKRNQVSPGPTAGTERQFTMIQVERCWDLHQYLTKMTEEGHCLLSRIPEVRCRWTGERRFLIRHFIESHNDIYKELSYIRCPSFKNTVRVMRCYDEMFLYYKYFSANGDMYAFVQKLGATILKFEYTIYLYSNECPSDNIIYRSRVALINEPLESILKQKSCLMIHKSRLRSFTLRGETDMIVEVILLPRNEQYLVRERKGSINRINEILKYSSSSQGTVTCPMINNPFPTCSWSCEPKMLVQHLLAEHGDIVTREPEFECRCIVHRPLLILFNDEVFMYLKYMSRTCMYAVVQQVGLTKEKYKYTVELRTNGPKEEIITSTFDVKPAVIPFDYISVTNDCMLISYHRMRRFTAKSEVNMKVRITRGHIPEETSVTGVE